MNAILNLIQDIFVNEKKSIPVDFVKYKKLPSLRTTLQKRIIRRKKVNGMLRTYH